MRYPVCGLLAVFVALLVPLIPVEAECCSPSFCQPTYLHPNELELVPTNLPALIMRYPLRYDDVGGASSIVWKDADGNPVPFEATQDSAYLVIKPTAALKDNTWYSLDYKEACPNGSYGVPPENAVTPRRIFGTSSSMPFPADPLAIRLDDMGVQTVTVANYTGACVESIQAAVVNIFIETMEFPFFLTTMKVETRVDGEVWNVSEPGALLEGAPRSIMDLNYSSALRNAQVLYAQCPMGSGSGDGGLSLGTHRVQVRLLLPGSDFVLTAPEEEVTFKCDDASAEAGSDVANDVPGGDSDDAVAEDRLGNGSTGSGCSAGRSSFGVPLLVILLLATAVAMFGRRKAV